MKERQRHIFFYTLLRPLVVVFLRLKFGYRFQTARNLPETYIVLANHTTDYDPIFVASSFPRQMYFVGSEHIARWKRFYKTVKYVFAPIMRPKGSLAGSTVMDILRKVRSGANVCIFAEGVRSWDGVTAPIMPSTGSLIKSAKCGLVTYKIEGGYFASPMWSGSNTRRGYTYGAPVRVYEKEDLAKMTVDEINQRIVEDLYEDAYVRQAENPRRYKGKNLAERMENLLFICPTCGELETLRSGGDTVKCGACGMSFQYDEYGMLHGLQYQTIRDLAAWQMEQVEHAVENGAVYTAAAATLTRVVNHEEQIVTRGTVALSRDSLCCGEIEIPMNEISNLAMHGKRAVVFTAGKIYYELIPEEPANALKFMLYYQQCEKMRENVKA